MTYAINDIYPTVQAEGELAGTPMMLIRLQGCDVGCSWCDSKETWTRVGTLVESPVTAFADRRTRSYVVMTVEEIAGWLSLRVPQPWALITGGEPAEQNLAELVDVLHRNKMQVAVETSGTAKGIVGAGADWVTLSPKRLGKKPLLTTITPYADEVKIVVDDVEDLRYAKALWEGNAGEYAWKANAKWYIQPVSLNEKATAMCVDFVLLSEGTWRLSIQTNKYINQP